VNKNEITTLIPDILYFSGLGNHIAVIDHSNSEAAYKITGYHQFFNVRFQQGRSNLKSRE
jgi:predicted metal-dependent TIM-barrel fold hydrolase